MDYLKAEHQQGTRWRVLAIPFGGPLKGRDIDGEFFSPRTDVKPDWFNERPVIFHHGDDAELKDTMIGREGPLSMERDGWWADMWLERQSRYYDRMERMLDAGRLYGSSASMPHLVKKASNGELLVWPHVEQTLTFTPVNLFSRVTAAKAVTDYDSAGIELDPALKGLLADLEALTDLTADLSAGGDHLHADGDAAAMARLEDIQSTLEGLKALI